MPTQSPPPPPPPPPGAPQRSHPSWNSVVSDITMTDIPVSEDEEGRSSSNHPYTRQQRQQQQQHPSRHSRQMVRNEDGAASLFEYSQSSEEAYSTTTGKGKQQQQQHKHRGNGRREKHAREDNSSTSFRFRGDLTQSSRIVRFGPSSDSELSGGSAGGGGGGSSARRQIAAEEGSVVRQKKGPSSDKNGRRHRHHHHHEHHRGGGATVNRETFLSTSNRWMTQLAYSFSTPPAPKSKKQPTLLNKQPSHDSGEKLAPSIDIASSSTAAKYVEGGNTQRGTAAVHPIQINHQGPPRSSPARAAHNNNTKNVHSESSPLLTLKEEEEDAATFPKHNRLRRHITQHGHQKLYASTHLHRHSYDYISIAVAFLRDYEAGRPPTLSSNVTWINPWQMGLYRIKFSAGYSILLGSATVALFLSSALEGPSQTDSNFRMHTLSGLNLYALVIFATDMWVRSQFQSLDFYQQSSSTAKRASPSKTFTALPVMVQTRKSQANLLTRPLFLFGLFLGLENMGWLLARPDRTFVVLYSSIWKPIVLYYISRQARHAMEALMRIAKTVIRVLVIELVLILSFAAVACRLFQDFESFDHLSVAWLSLFKLATTVVNPGIWMPIYQHSHWSAIFFVLFIVVTVFYMHSLVLSVVFQTYIQAATEIHDRSVIDREDSLQLAFAALKKQHQDDARKQQNHKQSSGSDEKKSAPNVAQPAGIPMYLVREVLESLRPHYNAMKINALVEFFDKHNATDVDYPAFRTKIRQALNASIRTARIASPLSMSIELTAVVVAMVNFVYVILLTSSFDARWFAAIELELGAVITIAGLVELLMRTNPLRVQNFTPMTRFNATFDGLAMLGAVISCIGIVLAIMGQPSALEYILMGRAVDMIRVMRFFQIFRDVVRRSSEVVPALMGPITLVLTMLHIFVYIGMAFWGGAIEVGELDQITPLYDLNNFNSYLEGMVTMFQVLVVNDWHAIAEVFLYASRCSSPRVVYPFFVIGNLFGVSILLNVITAFFVESFVTKMGAGTDGGVEKPSLGPSKDFSIRASEASGIKRMSSIHSISHMADDEADSDDADSEGSSDSSELFQFDVYEREGYDRIIETVTGGQQQDDFARQVCNQLELYESLTPGREKVGYLVCCQQTMNRYGNRRFETEGADFIGKMELHALVSDMHSELLVLLNSSKDSFNDRSLIRVYPHPTDPSKKFEISATIARRHPALSLFVSRIVP